MGLFNSIRMGASGAADAYEIDRSLRFNDDDSAYLNRTLASSNRRTWTISLWFKKGVTNVYQNVLFSSGGNINASFGIEQLSNQFRIYNYTSGMDWTLTTNAYYRDPSAWYHLILAVDTTQATASNRVKLYINGEQVTSFSTENYPSQDFENYVNYDVVHTIGCYQNNTLYWDGYITEVNFIDGTQCDPSSFGKTNLVTGQWIPIEYTGSYGTNGFYLNFSDNSGTTATTLGKDSSGNSNNFTPNNFSVASGIEGDSFVDTPTNNFCTLNPLVASGVGTSNTITTPTLSQGNLRRSGRTKVLLSTMPLLNNKYYMEYKMHDTMYGGYHAPGVYKSNGSQTTSGANDLSSYIDIGRINIDGVTQSGGIGSYGFNSYTNTDIIQFAIDTTQNPAKIWFGKNNTWENSGDPANGTNGFTLTADTEYVFCANYGSNHANGIQSTINFGGNGFAYTPPTGFVTASSANLPDPTIKIPDKHFETLIYTGNGSNGHAITGLEFQPDWLWLKKRNSTGHHGIYDAIRGVDKRLLADETGAEADTVPLASFDSGGFTFGSNTYYNNNTDTYVAWNWNGGGSTVTNNDGSISSQVRANPTAGFSIVTYSGNLSSAGSDTVGHGLGVAPKFIMIKRRDSTYGWSVATGGRIDGFLVNKILALDGLYSNPYSYNDYGATPTSSVFTVSYSSRTNFSGGTYVAYCFSEVEGYSRFGSYTSNNSTDGTFIYLGFKPALFIVKGIDANSDWVMWDNKRNTFNTRGSVLQPSNSDADYSSGVDIDFVSNGVKLRENSGYFNNPSGYGFVYFAFAESPFQYSRGA